MKNTLSQQENNLKLGKLISLRERNVYLEKLRQIEEYGENLEWKEAYDKMWWLSRDVQCPMNFKQGFDNVMKTLGYTYVGISNKKGSKRPTVEQFARTMKGKRAIAVVSNHYVGVKDGDFYDTEPYAREKHLYGYWYKDSLEDATLSDDWTAYEREDYTG